MATERQETEDVEDFVERNDEEGIQVESDDPEMGSQNFAQNETQESHQEDLHRPRHALVPMVSAVRGNRRTKWLHAAIRIEMLAICWVIMETVLSGMAALQAGSLAISTFSVDSGIELISGIVLATRLVVELRTGSDSFSKWIERLASGIVGGCLIALAAYISLRSGEAFALKQPTPFSSLGLFVAALSSVITPWLAIQKRRLGNRLHSHALIGDSACSMTCAYMAWTLLVGLLLQKAVGWWWVDPVAALGILYFVTKEAWDSGIAAWKGEAHVHAH